MADHLPIQSDAQRNSETRQAARAPKAVVRCKGFRCQAYLDDKGTWRSVADNSELTVLEVIMRF